MRKGKTARKARQQRAIARFQEDIEVMNRIIHDEDERYDLRAAMMRSVQQTQIVLNNTINNLKK